MGLQADMRAAAVDLLKDYGASANVKLQVYPARPRSLAPPTAFVDLIRESVEYIGPTLRQRRPIAEVVIVHAIFDSMEAANQKDAFIDGFMDYVNTRYHEAGANTLIAVTDTEDLPNFVPDWMPPEERLLYYATRVTMEGLALT